MMNDDNEYRYKELILKKLDKIISLLGSMVKEEKEMSVQLDVLQAEIESTEGIEDSAVVLLQGLSAQLVDLAAQLAQDGIDNQKLLDLSAELDAKSSALAAAVATYTPPAPPVVPAP